MSTTEAGATDTGGPSHDAGAGTVTTQVETTTRESPAGSDESNAVRSETARSETARSETAFCRACGSKILAAAEVCPECGVGQRGSGAHEEKNAALAALLSFVLAGAGQLYNGDVTKGIVLIVAELTLIMLITVTIWLFVGIVFVPFWLAIWGYAVWDAWDKAEKINRGEYEPSDSL